MNVELTGGPQLAVNADGRMEFASYMKAAIEAIDAANQEIDTLEATIRKLTLGETR